MHWDVRHVVTLRLQILSCYLSVMIHSFVKMDRYVVASATGGTSYTYHWDMTASNAAQVVSPK